MSAFSHHDALCEGVLQAFHFQLSIPANRVILIPFFLVHAFLYILVHAFLMQ